MGFLVVYTVFGVLRPELEVEKSVNSYNFALNPDWAAPYRAHRARRARQITHCAATGCKGKSRRRSLWLIKTSNKPRKIPRPKWKNTGPNKTLKKALRSRLKIRSEEHTSELQSRGHLV